MLFKGNAGVTLFVGLDVSNLPAIGTLPLCASGLSSGATGSSWRTFTSRRASVSGADAFLLLPSFAPFDVAFKAGKLGFESGRDLVS